MPLVPKKLYKFTSRLRTIDEVEEYFPSFKAFIDSTKQEIPRPKNKSRRKSYYYGKKKKHTVKMQYMVNSEGLILLKTEHKKGRKHAISEKKHILEIARKKKVDVLCIYIFSLNLLFHLFFVSALHFQLVFE
jgi:DDE superfamily endonuclease